jgi:hypothetical protein
MKEKFLEFREKVVIKYNESSKVKLIVVSFLIGFAVGVIVTII